jgi:hypothetical protein
VNSSDTKSIFGVLVGLMALFLLWLWASGNAAALWAVASGKPASSTASTAPAANVVGGNAAPLGGSPVSTGISVPNYVAPTATVAAVTVPQYINTTAAIAAPSTQSIGGFTYAGAQSGGVQITPTALLNTFSTPATTEITSTNTPLGQGGGAIANWLLNVLDPLGIGGGSVSPTASFGSYNDPAANVAGGNAAPLSG